MGEDDKQTLGKNSWSVNVYCMRAGSCEDKPGYLQNAEGGRESLIAQVVYS